MSTPLRIGIALSLAAAGMLVACAPAGEPTPRMRGAGVEGIDVSHHQLDIDWPAVAADDIAFAFIKATEGDDHTDTRFCDNWPESTRAGLTRGAYHFFRADVPAEAQFEHFRSVVELQHGDLPPALDVETTDGATEAELVEGLRTWLYLAEVHYGIKPVIYTNLKFYYHHLAGHFDDYPLWIARYGDRAPAVGTNAEVAFWQYGDRGRVAGVEGDVDLNVFVGEAAAFEALQLRGPALTTMAY